MAKRKKRNRGGGVPFNPDVDTGTKRPVTARVAVGDVNDKFSDYPSNGLTPRRLARIFREADEGNVRAQMELFEEMEEKDTHLFSQMQTRKLAVTGLDWEVQPFSEDEIDKEIADFIDEQLKGIENFDEVLIDMLDAIGKGISIMELAWTVEDGRNVIEDIEYVHPKKLVWDSTTDELKVCTREYPSGVELPENKFVVHKYKAKSGHASRAGIMRVGGIYLEGQVTSVEVQEAGSVYVAQDEKGRYKKSQPVGYENAKVMIDILLEDTKTATTLEQLTEMQRLFKPYGQDKPKLLPIVNEDCAVRGITKVYFKNLTSKKVISESKRIASLELWAPDIAGIKVKKKTTKKKTTKKSTKKSKSKKSKSKSPAKDSRNTSRGKKAARAAVK